MKNEKICNVVIDSFIDTVINDKDEDERASAYEWKILPTDIKLKVFGILAYWSGNSRMKNLFLAAKDIIKAVENDEEQIKPKIERYTDDKDTA